MKADIICYSALISACEKLGSSDKSGLHLRSETSTKGNYACISYIRYTKLDPFEKYRPKRTHISLFNRLKKKALQSIPLSQTKELTSCLKKRKKKKRLFFQKTAKVRCCSARRGRLLRLDQLCSSFSRCARSTASWT